MRSAEYRFNGGLGSGWSWIREDPTHWSLNARPGYLRIITQPGGLLGGGNDARNLLLRDVPPGYFEISTRMFYEPTANFQIAGLLIYQNDDSFLWLGRAFCDRPPPTCVGNGIYFDHEEGSGFIGSNFATKTRSQNMAYLRIVRTGKFYTGYYSEDGQAWKLVGQHVVTRRFAPWKIGVATDDSYQGAPEIPADFDYFQIKY